MSPIPASVLAPTVVLTLAAIAMAGPPTGPLKVLPSNPRYFTDGSGKAIYLAGSHTWNNLQEIERPAPARPNPVLDFGEFLSFLEARKHNCFRLWPWENAASFNAKGEVIYRQDPMPFTRSGPGEALDGRPKFDLTRFNQPYFDRLRLRVTAARDRGMYVIVMLFQGFSIVRKDDSHGDPWKGHPFHAANNVNGLDGDPKHEGNGLQTTCLTVPAVTAVQEAYVRKVIETINDLDNVLYEITNEDTGSPPNTQWQYHMIRFIRKCEAEKPKQHPVGMTVQYPNGRNEPLFESPADWISPNADGGYQTDPPAADGRKVILNDTDHSFYYTALQKATQDGQRAWVWKNFTRGNHVLFMDPYLDPTPWNHTARNRPKDGKPDPYWEMLRVSMGYARLYADRMDLAAMTPQPALASSGFCLACRSPKETELLIYLPAGPRVTVDLTGLEGNLAVEWFNPSGGAVQGSGDCGRGPAGPDRAVCRGRGALHGPAARGDREVTAR